MKYYATMYIDPIFDFEGATHAFLGLTKGKNPDELIRWINGVCLHESTI